MYPICFRFEYIMVENFEGIQAEGYTSKYEPLYYNYLRPLTSLNEGLYALACEEDVPFLTTLVRSFKLIEVCIGYGVMAVDSYRRPPPQVRATIEDITGEPGSSATIEPTASQVIKDVMRQLSLEKTELDREAGFGDVTGSGIESSGLSDVRSLYKLTRSVTTP
ncbi:hypothetical protein Tco_1116085 [Tanacetum coccineum]